MDIELLSKNFRAFQCTILDFERIMNIHRSRSMIHGVAKTAKYNDFFEKLIAEILLGAIPTTVILGSEDIKTKTLISYSIYQYPKNSSAAFLKLGETLSPDRSLFDYKDYDAIGALRLGVMLSESKKIFDLYMAVRINSFLPMMKIFHQSEIDEKDYHRSNWLLHKIINPNDPLETGIDRVLLQDMFLERKYPVAIIHTSLKAEYRVEHFKDQFNVSEETLKRYTIPNYSLTTSTTTESPTNS
jgi:hypothetical protein